MSEAVRQPRGARARSRNDYEWGFSSDIEQEFAPKGLSEDTVRFISAKKNEPEWMLDWRLKAYRAWLTMEEVELGQARHPRRSIIQDAYYYAAPKAKPKLGSLDEVDPEILRVYEKLGIPIEEQKVLAGRRGRAQGRGRRGVRQRLGRDHLPRGAEARRGDLPLDLRGDPRISRAGPANISASVVPQRDNYFACLNSAVFSDGTFVYVPEGVRCPMELSTYFRINAENTGQFERTLIVADKGSYVSYLEGCTAPMRDENQLHAAVVEICRARRCRDQIFDRPELVSGRRRGQGRHLQLRHQARALRRRRGRRSAGPRSRPAAAITWKYPSLHPQGRGQRRRILFGRADQQSPAGRHRHQDDPYRRQHPLDDRLQGDQRGAIEQHLSRAGAGAPRRRERPQLHPVRFSLLLGTECGAHTVPYIEVRNPTATIEHEATTRRSARTSCSTPCRAGSMPEEAVALIVNGFAREVLKQLPMEFAVEAQKLLGISALKGAWDDCRAAPLHLASPDFEHPLDWGDRPVRSKRSS